MPRRADVVAEALSWEGVPWRHQGRTRQGVDCVGLVVVVAHSLGLSDYDYRTYERRPNGEFMGHFTSNMDRVGVSELSPGDVVVLRDGLYPCHCGVLVERRGRLHLIHAKAGRRTVTVDPFEGNLRRLLISGFKFRGLED